MNLLGKTLNIEAKFKRTFLIEKLEQHLRNHLVDYAKAKEVYTQDRSLLFATLADAAKRSYDEGVDNTYQKLKRLQAPVDASEAYKQYISIFEAATDKEITLSTSDANAIINDSWDWAVQAKTTNAFYSSRG